MRRNSRMRLNPFCEQQVPELNLHHFCIYILLFAERIETLHAVVSVVVVDIIVVALVAVFVVVGLVVFMVAIVLLCSCIVTGH